MHWLDIERGQNVFNKENKPRREQEMKHLTLKQTLTIPGTFVGIGYTKDRASTGGGACSCPAAGGRPGSDPRRRLVTQPAGVQARRA